MNDTFTERDRDMIFLLSDSMNRLAAAMEKQAKQMEEGVLVESRKATLHSPNFSDPLNYFPDDPCHPCTNCASAPHNGGDGICNCTLPYFYEQGKLTAPVWRGRRMGIHPQYQSYTSITA